MKYFIAPILIAALAAVVLLRQYRVTAGLQAEIAPLAGLEEELARSQDENRQLLAAQISPEELGRLRSDHAALERLKAELAASAPAESSANAAVAPPSTTPELTPEEYRRRVTESDTYSRGLQPRSQWQNAGGNRPADTLETVFWAASKGNLGVLKPMLRLSDIAQWDAENLFDSLPPDLQQKYGTSEQMVASFVESDLSPVQSLQIVARNESSRPTIFHSVRLQLSPTGTDSRVTSTTDVRFSFRLVGDSWRLEVPLAAIESHRQQLGLSP